MNNLFAFIGTVFALLWAISGIAFSQELDPVARQIFIIIQAGQKTNILTCRKERICGISAIPEFYRKRGYAPAWTLEGNPTPHARELLSSLASSRYEGLSPEIYHYSEIQNILAQLGKSDSGSGTTTPSTLAELDILLTDAFLLYATHLFSGRVDPETIHTAWEAFHPEIDLARELSEALATGRIAEKLAVLTPSDEGYRRLKAALLTYREIAAEKRWLQIPSGPALKTGETDARVALLRKLFKVTGDLENTADETSLFFDNPMDSALRRFQCRHGLEADGILGKETLNQLNRPVAGRIRQMELNLERWRWLPHKLGQRHILVNIAAFQLHVMESGRSILTMRVVVGTHFRKTPVFSETMKYLVINPYWNVPFRIAIEDKLPLIRKNPSYLLENGYRVLNGWEGDVTEVAPENIDWSGITPRNFLYRLRQDPGPQNALGRIKFMFPNRFSVYLHDTPQHRLFNSTVRAFSSGCIRVEKPLELATYLLKEDPAWSKEQIEKAIISDKNRIIILKNRVPVHLLYWTAWVEPDGAIHFRKDIYGRDLLLDRALKERPLSTESPIGKTYQ